MNTVSAKFSVPGIEGTGKPLNLAPIFTDNKNPTLEEWLKKREEIKQQWLVILGKPSFSTYEKKETVVDSIKGPGWKGKIIQQTTGPESSQKIVLMEPEQKLDGLRPGAVLPYYHPDIKVGMDIGGLKFACEKDYSDCMDEFRLHHYGRHLVSQGYVVVCTEAFPYNTVPELSPRTDITPLNGVWQAAADKLLAQNPKWTGMGKLIADTSRAVDLLLSVEKIDKNRIVAMGHSLGGKMPFCTGALDDRIKAVISSDFGIGLNFSNWERDWYYGKQILDPSFTFDHHLILALLAPRPFFLIGGNTDHPESWQYLREAEQIYKLYDKKHALGYFYHGTGHPPTEESIKTAYEWLAEQFDLSKQSWESFK